MKTFNFSKLLLSDDKKNFSKDTKNSIHKAKKMLSDFFFEQRKYKTNLSSHTIASNIPYFYKEDPTFFEKLLDFTSLYSWHESLDSYLWRFMKIFLWAFIKLTLGIVFKFQISRIFLACKVTMRKDIQCGQFLIPYITSKKKWYLQWPSYNWIMIK